ncbi:uncharacterized protein [Eleutherodactylus coqui]|uniref:uncharacterized protein n=1 Tax=Eleutherodactylus coqui TaxID=57060 RepID=UPI003461C22A
MTGRRKQQEGPGAAEGKKTGQIGRFFGAPDAARQAPKMAATRGRSTPRQPTQRDEPSRADRSTAEDTGEHRERGRISSASDSSRQSSPSLSPSSTAETHEACITSQKQAPAMPSVHNEREKSPPSSLTNPQQHRSPIGGKSPSLIPASRTREKASTSRAADPPEAQNSSQKLPPAAAAAHRARDKAPSPSAANKYGTCSTAQNTEQTVPPAHSSGGGLHTPKAAGTPGTCSSTQEGTRPKQSIPPALGAESSGKDTTEQEADWDWKKHLKTLPTTSDIIQLFQQFEEKQLQALSSLQTEVHQLGHRVNELEETQEETHSTLTAHDQAIKAQAAQITDIMSHLEDLENRHRRNNLRIRGLPEDIGNDQLEAWAQNFFSSLLQRPADQQLEIDRIHRALGPRSTDPKRPRDIICRVHFFKEKEAIIRQARLCKDLAHEGSTILILPDLARRTLQQRKALKPVVDVLREQNIPYRWGFPFQLTASREGRSASFRTLNDLPKFLETLNLPPTTLPDWPAPLSLPTRTPREQWEKAHPRPQRKTRGRRDNQN